MDCIMDILEKRDKLGCEDDPEPPDYWRWHFLQAMNKALCSVCAHKSASAGSALYARQVLLGQPAEREKRFQWADEKQVRPIVHGHKYGDAYSAIIYLQQVSLNMKTVEYFVMLDASLFCLYLARVIFYATQAVNLMCCSLLKVEMVIVDNYKARTAQNLGASRDPTPVVSRYDADSLSASMRREISLITSFEVIHC